MLVDTGYLSGLAKRCLICGELVDIEAHEIYSPKICDKCKAAVMFIREQMEERRESDETCKG